MITTGFSLTFYSTNEQKHKTSQHKTNKQTMNTLTQQPRKTIRIASATNQTLITHDELQQYSMACRP